MPKLKTHKGAAKRLKRTGSGRLSRRRAYASHLLGHKRRKRKRRLRKPALVDRTDEKRLKKLLPYE